MASKSLARCALPQGSTPTSNRSAVVRRDSCCASPRCLQATQVVETKRELLERDCAIAAAAAVAEKLIHSHVRGQQRDRRRPLCGCRAACVWHAAEGQQGRRFGLQQSLLRPAAGAGQLGLVEQPRQLRAAEEAAGRDGARRTAPTVNRCRTQCWQTITNSR